jgi:hypothetical protein
MPTIKGYGMWSSVVLRVTRVLSVAVGAAKIGWDSG